MNGGNVLPYIDGPVPACFAAVLKAMRRPPGGQEKTLERVHAWRTMCPDLTIRSTLVVGSPGETEEAFRHFPARLARRSQLDRVGAFQYEPVKGAAANDLGLERAGRHQSEPLQTFHGSRAGDQPEEARRQGRQAPRPSSTRAARARPRAAPKATRRRSTRPSAATRRPVACGRIVTVKVEAPDAYDSGGRQLDGRDTVHATGRSPRAESTPAPRAVEHA